MGPVSQYDNFEKTIKTKNKNKEKKYNKNKKNYFMILK